MSDRPMCGFKIREAFCTERSCRAPGKWIVWFTTPDVGVTMRKRSCVIRCFHHREERFFPKGATQIVTEAYLSPSTPASFSTSDRSLEPPL